MSLIINLEDAKQKLRGKNKTPLSEDSHDITSLLKDASKSIAFLQELEKQNSEIVANPLALFQGKLNQTIKRRNLIAQDYFLCGIYIAKLLTSILERKNLPESWFAIDFIKKGNDSNNPEHIKQGANVCFLICTIFPGRAEIKMMTIKDYMKMGKTLFRQFYCSTGMEIGYHMSQQFPTMVEVTNECLETL